MYVPVDTKGFCSLSIKTCKNRHVPNNAITICSLLSYVSNLEAQQYQDKKKTNVIEPAVTYLHKNIYKCDLKIDELHQLCGISDSYFRKIFISAFGTNPKDYVISKRISYAKSIIDSGEFNTVKELALMVGYKDPLYFGKVFKQHYGVSPVNMNRWTY